MVKPRNTQDNTAASTLKLLERITLAICVVTIGAAFALMGVFFTVSWLFFLIFIADLTTLVIGRVPDITKRLILFISVIGAVLALGFVMASHPWLLL